MEEISETMNQLKQLEAQVSSHLLEHSKSSERFSDEGIKFQTFLENLQISFRKVQKIFGSGRRDFDDEIFSSLTIRVSSMSHHFADFKFFVDYFLMVLKVF